MPRSLACACGMEKSEGAAFMLECNAAMYCQRGAGL